MQTKTNSQGDIVFVFDTQYPFYVYITNESKVALTEGEGQIESPEWEDCDPSDFASVLGNVFVTDENSVVEKMIVYLLMLGVGIVS